MSAPVDGKSVHTIVWACLDATAAAGDLRRLVDHAIERTGAEAERVVDVDAGVAAIFRNSTAALDYAQQIHAVAAGGGQTLKLGVHLGPVDADDEQIALRAPLRMARQIADLARARQTLVSQVFHGVVSHFDHACKNRLHRVDDVVDAQGRKHPVFEARFDAASARRVGPAAPTAAAKRDAAADSSGFLPQDPARREAFLARAADLLAAEIGPIARMIVRKAEATARTRTAFHQQLVDAVPNEAGRAALLKALARQD